jgi:hypothetical protein
MLRLILSRLLLLPKDSESCSCKAKVVITNTADNSEIKTFNISYVAHKLQDSTTEVQVQQINE